MQLFKYLAIATLATTALAAKKAPAQTYDKYSKASVPIDVDEKSYAELTKAPRDYGVAILLTAIDSKYGCQVCKEFDPEWNVVSRSWSKQDKKGSTRMLFGTLDFDRGKSVFMQMQLQTAPVLMLFPPTVGPNANPDAGGIRLDFIGPQTAEMVHNWITRQLPPGEYPSLVRPVNYGRIVTTVTVLVGLFTLATVAYPYVLPVIQNRNVWAAISLILVLMFTSGHMYNHIRKVPYVANNGQNGISYFAGGFSNQYGIETQIIAAIYAVLSFALIALGLKVPRMKDARAQQVAAIIWASVLFGMYSFLMSVFRVKNGGYPFWLPPF